MIIRLSAPSKTFLTGEYAVLKGAPALVINSEPRFTFTATKGDHSVSGIPKGSPAARWIEQRSSLLQDWKLEFQDPHLGLGGFGASSAQFLFVHVLTTFLQISVNRALEGLDLKSIWNDYQVLSGGKASGVDVLAQATGGLALIDRPNHFFKSNPWPYPELDFAILRTRNKVQTHVHLENLDLNPLQSLVQSAEKCAADFGNGNAETFLANVKEYSLALRELKLQAPETLEWIKALEGESWCKLAKGCGAMGADTVAVFFASADRADAVRFFAKQNYESVATTHNLSPGLEMQWSWK